MAIYFLYFMSLEVFIRTTKPDHFADNKTWQPHPLTGPHSFQKVGHLKMWPKALRLLQNLKDDIFSTREMSQIMGKIINDFLDYLISFDLKSN